MKLQIAWIGKTKEAAIRALTDEYLKRISRYVGAESHEMNSEEALLDLAAGTTGRTAPVLVLLMPVDASSPQKSLPVFCVTSRTVERRTFFSVLGRRTALVTRPAAAPTLSFPLAK